MSKEWRRVETIHGYERTYRQGPHRVAYKPVDPGAAYVHRHLFVDGSEIAIPLPPVYVQESETLTDEVYEKDLSSVTWYISSTR